MDVFECLLQAVKEFFEKSLKGLNLPVNQDGRDDVNEREVRVYKQVMPDPEEDNQKVPYILLTILNGSDGESESVVTVRVVITIFDDDPEDGKALLLHIVEKLRLELLKKRVVGERYRLVVSDKHPFEYLFYPDDSGLYHLAELSMTWTIPQVDEEIMGLHYPE